MIANSISTLALHQGTRLLLVFSVHLVGSTRTVFVTGIPLSPSVNSAWTCMSCVSTVCDMIMEVVWGHKSPITFEDTSVPRLRRYLGCFLGFEKNSRRSISFLASSPWHNFGKSIVFSSEKAQAVVDTNLLF